VSLRHNRLSKDFELPERFYDPNHIELLHELLLGLLKQEVLLVLLIPSQIP
jgi:hypothetical protein